MIQILQIHKLPFAPVAIIGRMFIGNVVLETVFGLEYGIAIVASVPMFGLFMPKAQLSGVCGPSSEAPTAFDLV